ncbi:hypothetical protein [Sphingomonas bacterium]|uniref:hypothetical protein n=1 Tax=Sphingomonas bacterium TaxID=1895847 RepID=UPI001574FD3E|nr:hypothetical protein [Sphingomonas bacterium]
MILGAVLLAALQVGSAVTADGKLLPASEAAVLAGARACVGATVDPAGQDARLTGWPSVIGSDADKDPSGAAKRVASKDGVRLVVATGVDGGCVVDARGDAAFGPTRFYADLGKQVGVTIDKAKPVVDLPNGELMVVQVGAEKGVQYIQLVVANRNGKYAKKYSKGN